MFSWFSDSTVLYALEWLIRLGALLIVPFRRSPAAARSWLILIFFLPEFGLLLFWLIGSPRFPAWRVERFKRMRQFLRDLGARLRSRGDLVDQGDPVTDLAERLGYLPAVSGNALELLDDYCGTIDRLVADIDSARRHVRILTYIFADDEVGRRVIAALGRAMRRGVACHVLIDTIGSYRWVRRTLRLLQKEGVPARAALPFRPFRHRTRRDMRNHRKLFLIDGEIGYAGSQNIICGDFRPGVVNRELVARVTGPAVAEMTAVFLTDWYLETEQLLEPEPPIPERAGECRMQVLPSGADYPLEGFQTLLTWQVDRAEKEVVLVTPYFVPDDSLVSALSTAVLRGVDVRVIVSRVVDQPLVNLAQSSYYDQLLSSGVRLHRYREFLLHAKAVRIDDRLGIIGSSNVDIRSFQLNEEVSLLLVDGPSLTRLHELQDSYIAASDELSLEEWRRRSPFRKLAEGAARLVGPLL
jgi:cardiolipin synthase A/B